MGYCWSYLNIRINHLQHSEEYQESKVGRSSLLVKKRNGVGYSKNKEVLSSAGIPETGPGLGARLHA